MRISKKMEAALNEQINAELYSSYLYYAMAAYLEAENFRGMANWMKVQAQEELVHVTKFFEYVNERGGRVVLDAIAKPPSEWDSPADAFAQAYAHEQMISDRINRLVAIAEEEKDRATLAFLQWFVTEQVEEESSAKTVADQLAMLAGAPHTLFMMDRELGQRTFTPPAATP